MNIVLDVQLRFGDLGAAVDETIARTKNISREGLFIRMEQPKAVGTHVKLTFVIVGRGQIVLEGVVIRAVPDPGDPGEPGVSQADRGVAIHIASATEGWERFCQLVEDRRVELQGVDVDLD